jgi:hypothetical protein
MCQMTWQFPRGDASGRRLAEAGSAGRVGASLISEAGNNSLAVWRRIETCRARLAFLLRRARPITVRGPHAAKVLEYQHRRAIGPTRAEKSLCKGKVPRSSMVKGSCAGLRWSSVGPKSTLAPCRIGRTGVILRLSVQRTERDQNGCETKAPHLTCPRSTRPTALWIRLGFRGSAGPGRVLFRCAETAAGGDGEAARHNSLAGVVRQDQRASVTAWSCRESKRAPGVVPGLSFVA